jgi:hypothetical protein
MCLPCCLLLACVWHLPAQQTSVKDQKKPETRTGDGASTVRVEDQLIQLEKQWAEAGVKGDVGFFERTAAADYLIVDCDGTLRNKQQEIANFRQEAQTSQTVEDLKVRVYEGSAVVVGKFTITGTYAGQPNNLSGRFTDVWIRHNRTWQLVSTQNTCKAAVDGYTIENTKVLHPSTNTALLLYNSNCKGTGTWTEFYSHPSRISDLFIKRNGQWVALFRQDTD